MNLLQMSFSGAVYIIAIVLLRAFAVYKLPKITFPVLWEMVFFRLLIPFSIPSVFSVYTLMNNCIARFRPACCLFGRLVCRSNHFDDFFRHILAALPDCISDGASRPPCFCGTMDKKMFLKTPDFHKAIGQNFLAADLWHFPPCYFNAGRYGLGRRKPAAIHIRP